MKAYHAICLSGGLLVAVAVGCGHDDVCVQDGELYNPNGTCINGQFVPTGGAGGSGASSGTTTNSGGGGASSGTTTNSGGSGASTGTTTNSGGNGGSISTNVGGFGGDNTGGGGMGGAGTSSGGNGAGGMLVGGGGSGTSSGGSGGMAGSGGGNTGGAGGGPNCPPGDTPCGSVCCSGNDYCNVQHVCTACPNPLTACNQYNNTMSMEVTCDGTEADCCKDVDTDLHNCGGCSTDCPAANFTQCVNGFCQ